MPDGLATDTYFPFLFVYRRSMQRSGPRGPKRSPTPTSTAPPSATSADYMPPASPSAPVAGTQKPLYLCSPFVEAALVKGNFKTIVMLPKYVDIMEWVAVNSAYYRPFQRSQHSAHVRTYRNPNKRVVFDFFQNLNMFYGVISECCTQPSCPTMSAGAT
jgi:MOB kinase activator 1